MREARVNFEVTRLGVAVGSRCVIIDQVAVDVWKVRFDDGQELFLATTQLDVSSVTPEESKDVTTSGDGDAGVRGMQGSADGIQDAQDNSCAGLP